MKAKMYIAPTKYAYRVAEDGQSIQFLDTSMNLGWKRSDYMTGKVFKIGRPAQEVLDEEAAQRGWQPWEEPEEQADADKAQSNAVQLAEDVLSAVKHFKGELTADGCRQAVGKSYYSHCGLDSGEFQCSPRGVKLIPRDGDFMDLTWSKFIKFCRENGLIENPTAAAGTAPQSAPTASDAQSSPCPSSDADAPTEEKTPLNNYCKTGKSPSGHCGAAACCSEPYECCAQCPNDCNSRCGWISVKEKPVSCKTESIPNAVTAGSNTSPSTFSPAATAAAEVTVADPEASACASTMTAPAASNCEAAGLAVGAKAALTNAAAFDYTGLDRPTVDTLHWAEREICDARRDYVARLAQAVHIVHDALCGGVVHNVDNSKHGNRGDAAFVSWCASVGLGKTTAYKLLQVAALLKGSTPEEQAVLEAASPSLLYAAAKPSAPAQLVEGVKSGDITTHKQYQELLARLKTTEEELASERADREAERTSTSALLADEQHRRQEANEARIAAEKAVQGAKESYRAAHKNEELARRRAEEAEKTAKEAQKNEMLQIQRARDAENQRSMMEERERFHLARIAELEARPVEVVGADPDEIERRAQVLADQKTAQIQAELAKVRTEQKASDNQSVQRTAYDAVILAGRSIEAAWQALAPLLPRLAPEQKSNAIYRFCNQLMIIKEEALETLKTEDNPNADHQN